MIPEILKIPRFSLLAAAWISLATCATAANPLIDFPFDEGSGTKITDTLNSLSGNPGDPSNPPTFVTDSPSGKSDDSAVQFEAGQYFTVDDPDTRMQLDPNNPSFTLQAWLKLPPGDPPSGRMVFFYSNGPGGAVSFSVNNNRTVFVTTLGIADVSSQALIPDDNQWHHVAVVHDAGIELRFYVDGVLGDSVPYTSGVNFTRTQKLFSIGSEWNGALQYTGMLDRLKASSGVLMPEELDSLASPPTLLADFPFDEGTGTTVGDIINSLSGVAADPANAPTFETASPSGQAGDSAVHFESGQYFTVDDPDTRVQFNPNNPNFTLQAWVKFPGNPPGRQVFFYSNGPGGAVSFSVNSDRTVFVTTLGIADVSSQASIPDDEEWHHIAVVHEYGVEIRFYVDGVLGDSVPYTGGVNFSRTQKLFSIGAEWNGALQYTGSVDRLKVTSGLLSAEQLDYQKVPPAGTAALVIGRPSVTPFNYSVGVTEVGGSVVDPDTIVLTFDGTSATPTSVTKRGATTTISYDIPNSPLPSESSHTASLTIKDRAGVSYSGNATFVIAAYGTLPLNAALPASSVDPAKKGFRIKTFQIESGSQDGTIAYNEDLLAGNLGPNVANTDDAGGLDTGGYYTWSDVINFDTSTPAANGYFNDPDYLDFNFPGIPGITDSLENFAEELIAALEFKSAGMYTMAVNTDWTGFPNASDGYQVRSGTDPLNPATSVVLGFFDALAPDGPSRGLANTPFQFYVSTPGIYPFRLLYYQTAISANLEWFILNPDGTRTLINDAAKSDTIAAYYEWTTPATAPTLSFTVGAGGLILTFEGTLEGADSITGTWQPIPGASPMTVPTTGAMNFYRARD